MLNELVIHNVTAFRQATFRFGGGLNVLIGDNGTGKTHVLKLGYLFCKAWPALTQNKLRLDKQRAESYVEERLAGLFRVSDLSHLISQGQRSGAGLSATIHGRIPTVQFGIPTVYHRERSDSQPSPAFVESMSWAIRLKRDKEQHGSVDVTAFPENVPTNSYVPRAVLVPSKEIVSLFKGLVGLFDAYRDFPLDETYRDLASSLAVLEPTEAPSLLSDVAASIADVVGGELRLVDGELVLARADGSSLESTLMAEGHRKLALLVYLVRQRVVEAGGTLFWDEPEANLNPKAIRLMVSALHALAQGGVQVILATHSLFLLREIEVLATQQPGSVPPRYFALGQSKKGVVASAGDDLATIDPLVLLDEDLAQSDRFVEALK